MKLPEAFILVAVALATLIMAQETEQSGITTHGPSRFLAQNNPRAISCRRNLHICRDPGSLGSTCCNNKCVDVKTDKHDCGACGVKCKFTETCCRGKCVNLAYDKRHCGRCNNRCKKGQYCVYGLCNYG